MPSVSQGAPRAAIFTLSPTQRHIRTQKATFTFGRWVVQERPPFGTRMARRQTVSDTTPCTACSEKNLEVFGRVSPRLMDRRFISFWKKQLGKHTPAVFPWPCSMSCVKRFRISVDIVCSRDLDSVCYAHVARTEVLSAPAAFGCT
eukprot:1888694-Pleurochrysis_carterae.AAC.3